MDFSEECIKGGPLPQEERRFTANAKESIRLCHDGRYEMPLPVKNANIALPNNRELSLRRLMPPKKRFSADTSFREPFITFMDSMIKIGYAEKVPTSGSDSSPETNSCVWFIPHHGVLHPKKLSKIRAVFDCSAVF